jgi:glycosyltransferase 2 family protein
MPGSEAVDPMIVSTGLATTRKPGDINEYVATIAAVCWRDLVWLVIPALLVVGGLVEWHSTVAGLVVLRSARWYWVLAAAFCAAGLFLAGTACQQGAVLRHLPRRRLLAVQVASAVGSVGLGPLGGGYINVRFLRRLGMSRPEAIGAVSLNSAANASTHLLLLPLLLAILPDGTLPINVPVPSGRTLAMLLLAGAAAAVTVAVHRQRFVDLVRPLTRRLARGGTGLLKVWRDPVRAIQLWSGAVGTAFLHGVVLYCMVHAVGLPLSVGSAMLVYLAASSAAGLVPSPGGLGALDVALALVLARAGAPPSTLIAAVAGYRIVTSWLPLLPATVTLAVLVRRQLI